MRIRLYSDLHVEFGPFEPPQEKADVVVLAGDIHVGVKGVEWAVSQNFGCPVIYVLGNHEYYGHSYPGLIKKTKAAAAGKAIHVLENESVEIDGIKFHGATLWTNFELFGDAPLAGFHCQQVMNDYKMIRKDLSYSKVRAMDLAAIHQHSISWLRRSLLASDCEKNIVITHHAPSLRSVFEMYREDMTSAAYASNLEGFITELKPDFWFHGHTHSSNDYEIGNCRVVCNPRGYKGEENYAFQAAGIVELE
ncbi:MAG: metallophosphoesterase [Moraxellaceae bacterium]|nr:metallophosphoesterase [Moraxellaceae bacterium]